MDYTVNAAIGFPWITDPAGWPGPEIHVLPAWDVSTGYLAALGLVIGPSDRRSPSAGVRRDPARAAPRLGADADFVLSTWLGLLPEQVRGLVADGIVGAVVP